MRRGPSSIVILAAWLAAGSAGAQSPPAPPRPGPETTKLAYFVGRWRSESQMKPGPFGPGGRVSGTDTCEWFSGGFHLICRSEGKGALGDVKGMSIISWDPDEKAYSYYAFDHRGITEQARGTFDGTTWTWSSESSMSGRAVKGRYTIVAQGPAAYTFKWEASLDGAPLAVVMEGKGSKAR